MSKRQKTYTNHHECPQHPAGTNLEGSNHPNNIIRISDVKHRAIHDLFENLMFPEQVLRLIELSGTALRPEVKEELIEVLNRRDIHDPRQWYRDECIK